MKAREIVPIKQIQPPLRSSMVALLVLTLIVGNARNEAALPTKKMVSP